MLHRQLVKRILLVDPKGFGSGLNLGLGYLAAVLVKAGYKVKVVDLNNSSRKLAQGPSLKIKKKQEVSWQEKINRVLDWQPDVIGITINSFTLENATGIAKLCREKLGGKAIYFAGGPHVTIFKEEFMNDYHNLFDFAMYGEGEKTVLDLLEHLNTPGQVRGLLYYDQEQRRVIKTEPRLPIQDLDNLPFPNFEVFDTVARAGQLFNYQLISSRGCPYQCVFCCQVLSKKWRARSPENIIAEIKQAREKYNIKTLTFWDDNFTLDINRSKEICDLLKNTGWGLKYGLAGVRADLIDEELVQKLKESGCSDVCLGIEDGDPETFPYVKKGETLEDIERAVKLFKRYDIPIVTYMITGLINHTYRSFLRSLKFIERLGVVAHWNIAFPFPNTPLYDWAKRHGRFLMSLEEGFKQSMTSREPPVIFDTPEYPKEERIKAHYLGNLRSRAYDMVVSSRDDSLFVQMKDILSAIWKYDRSRTLWHLANLSQLFYQWSPLGNVLKTFYKILPFIFLVLVVLVPLSWFKGNLLIAGGDEYGLLDQSAFTNLYRYIWNTKMANGGGVVLSIPKLFPMLAFWTLLKSRGVSLVDIEKIWAVAMFLSPGLAMYYLVAKLGGNRLARLTAALFYVFNLFAVVTGPLQSNIRPVLIGLPLVFAFFREGLRGKPKHFLKNSILVGLCSLIYASSSVNPPTVAIVPLILFFYFVWYVLLHRGRFVHSFKFALSAGGCYLLFNFWWVINFVAGFLAESGATKQIATFSALDTGSMLDFFRLLGSWGWRSGHYGMSYFPFASSYDSPLLLIFSFVLPILALSAVLLKPKNKTILFFTFLALIGLFLSKGASSPFGSLYKWLWENLPGFWVFREPFSKFTPITLFAYSVLIGLALELIDNKLTFWMAKMVPLVVLGMILAVAFPLLTGEVIWDRWNGSMRSFRAEVPEYWYQARDWLREHDPNARILLSPQGGYGAAYNWEHGFSSADSPALAVLDNTVLRNSFPLSFTDKLVNSTYVLSRNNDTGGYSRLTSFLNAGYVLQENDLDWRYTESALSPSLAKRFLVSSGFIPVAEFGRFDSDYLAKIPNDEHNQNLRAGLERELLGQPALVLYKADQAEFLPRFYSPQEVIYANNNLEALADLSVFRNYPVRSAFYTLSEDDFAGDGSDQSLITRASDIFIRPEKVDVVAVKTILPDARILPDSPFYVFVKWKEQRLLRKEASDLSRADLRLWFTSKRLVEARDLFEKQRREAALQACAEYTRQLASLVDSLEDLFQEYGSSFYQLLDKANLYFLNHRGILEAIRDDVEDSAFTDKLPEIYSLHNRVNRLVVDKSRKAYVFDAPWEGSYQLFFKDEPGLATYFEPGALEEITLTLDRKEVANFSGKDLGNGWFEYPAITFGYGNHLISVKSPRPINLVENGSFENDTFQSATHLSLSNEAIDGLHSLQIVVTEGQDLEIPLPIRALKPGASYRLSFDYKTLLGNPLKVAIRQSKEGFGYVYLNKAGLDRSPFWLDYETVFTTKINSSDNAVVFIALPGPGKGVSLLDNLKVERIFEPTLLLRAIDHQPATDLTVPKLSYARLNPTKYKVLVSGASGPYSLVFSESYHSGWKAYIKESQISDLRPQDSTAKDTSQYFGGDIVESKLENRFWDAGIFENVGKKPIPEERHQLVNGYANSWYILPDDAAGNQEYEIIIEFVPQRLLYVGLLVSVVSLAGGFLYLLISVHRK